ncbi:hypothetical protein GCM10022251_77950 [Phytohabitans flavus]|uniref:Uncharacterized protein n=1 Tax=Phytohabitans flavus TaxID=1076124 RepID=A0A6F8XNJ5_9ACTN|nr:hypothetical protein [Phytohabitans flavus]BCB75393.1 hypothetical protein Pflav_018030 [Phytohabitans flavus]
MDRPDTLGHTVVTALNQHTCNFHYKLVVATPGNDYKLVAMHAHPDDIAQTYWDLHTQRNQPEHVIAR